MACPTCSATMESLHSSEELCVYQCRRCGTTKVEDSSADGPSVRVPDLVERCRLFARGRKAAGPLTGEDGLGALSSEAYAEAIAIWRRLGIDDAIGEPIPVPGTPFPSTIDWVKSGNH